MAKAKRPTVADLKKRIADLEVEIATMRARQIFVVPIAVPPLVHTWPWYPVKTTFDATCGGQSVVGNGSTILAGVVAGSRC